jgi:hypothetical protein
MAAFLSDFLRIFCESWAEDHDGQKVPLVNSLCPSCDGEGKRALHGYDVTEMIREDPDFGQDYFAGHYDTLCNDCRGSGVIKDFDGESFSASPEMIATWNRYCNDYYDDLATQAAEIAAGC